MHAHQVGARVVGLRERVEAPPQQAEALEEHLADEPGLVAEQLVDGRRRGVRAVRATLRVVKPAAPSLREHRDRATCSTRSRSSGVRCFARGTVAPNAASGADDVGLDRGADRRERRARARGAWSRRGRRGRAWRAAPRRARAVRCSSLAGTTRSRKPAATASSGAYISALIDGAVEVRRREPLAADLDAEVRHGDADRDLVRADPVTARARRRGSRPRARGTRPSRSRGRCRRSRPASGRRGSARRARSPCAPSRYASAPPRARGRADRSPRRTRPRAR